MSHSAKKNRRGTLLCFRKLLVSKKFMDNRGERDGGSITIFCQKFLSHSAENFRRVTLQCFSNFGFRKRLEIREGVSRFSVEIVVSHSTKKIRWGTCPGFRKILVSKRLMHKGGGRYHDFPS